MATVRNGTLFCCRVICILPYKMKKLNSSRERVSTETDERNYQNITFMLLCRRIKLFNSNVYTYIELWGCSTGYLMMVERLNLRRKEAAPQLICNLIAPISNSIFFRHLECHVSGMPVRTTPTTQIHLATSLFTIRSTSNYAPSYPILPWAATLPFMCVVIKYRI